MKIYRSYIELDDEDKGKTFEQLHREMVNMKKIKEIQKKYGITIRDDGFYSPLTGKTVKCYRIYTADGCPWENGLTFRGLQADCREYGDVF